jgi:hypothetical protein
MLLGAAAEFAMGRTLWGTGGTPGFWSGDIWSAHNSQYLFDPYTFTHIVHGVLLYALLRGRLLGVIAVETGWEVLENSSPVIERYRAETVSLNYYGDSVLNSMCDIAACIVGFKLASRLPTKATVLGTVAVELVLLAWTRDNLTLNIVMLIHPSPGIRAWQMSR